LDPTYQNTIRDYRLLLSSPLTIKGWADQIPT
jgi:hypothetical protein